MWSLGVILYLMISGTTPFSGASEGKILESVKSMKYGLERKRRRRNQNVVSVWDDVSPECKNMIASLLVNKDKRLKPEQVLNHPWLKVRCKEPPLKIEVTSAIVKSLRAFRDAEKLKKAVLTYIATQLSESEIAPLRTLYKALDTNGDGSLSRDEVREALKGRADEEELAGLIISIDTDGSGSIEYNG